MKKRLLTKVTLATKGVVMKIVNPTVVSPTIITIVGLIINSNSITTMSYSRSHLNYLMKCDFIYNIRILFLFI